MRILYFSDLHNEHRDPDFRFPEIDVDFDVAVLAGDIDKPIDKALAWIAHERDHGALKKRPVIYVPGNHEFYDAALAMDMSEAMEHASQLGIHLLAPGVVTIGEVRFIGATLWTDYALNGQAEVAKIAAQLSLDDHKRIAFGTAASNEPFTADHAARLHKRDRRFIEDKLSEISSKVVVVTHHAPHRNSVVRTGDPLSAAFASDLSTMIEVLEPTLWIHGHDHGSHHYRVGETLIVTNQHGYLRDGASQNPEFRFNKVVEI